MEHSFSSPVVDTEAFDRSSLGERLRQIRKEKGWTLSDVSARTGLAVSTVSKVERGRITLAYDKFMALARGLDLDITELIGHAGTRFKPGALAVTRATDAFVHETDTYVYEMLNTQLRNKHMIPSRVRIKARDISEFADYIRHQGEEFVYVLSGRLKVFVEGRDPVILDPGDSMYFDSHQGHLYTSVGSQDAVVVGMCWQPEGADALLQPITGDEADD